MTSASPARISLLPCVSVVLLTLVSPTASAQIDAGAVDTGITDSLAMPPVPLARDDFAFFIERWDALVGAWVMLDPTEQAFFFDRARCECAEDANDFAGSIRIAIQPSAAAGQKIRALLAANLVDGGTARLYAGGATLNCLVPSSAPSGTASLYCLNLLDPSYSGASIPGGMAVFLTQRVWLSPPIPIAWLFGATRAPVCNSPQSCNQTSACGSSEAAPTIYFWAQTSSLALPDRTDYAFTVNLVGRGPEAPSDVAVEAADEALAVRWDWPPGLNPAADASFLGVQLFCVRGQSDQVFASRTFAAAFTTSAWLCPAVAPTPASPAPFANFDPRYLCSPLLPATATSHRIIGLQNGIYYGIGVAAVDKYGNLSLADVVYQAPEGSDSDAGAVDPGVRAAGGGGCALAGGHGPCDAGAALGLLALGALLLGRTRSRRPQRSTRY